jgi:aminoglycoside phosphotransferase (APT) family kinase protein
MLAYAELVGHLSTDRYLDEEIVSGLVATQFPDLGGQAVSRLGGGWDHELFCIGGEWVFRFPRRAERVPWLAREIQITVLVAETLAALSALPAAIPVFERIGEPSAAFPYLFVGYRRVPGVGADLVCAGDGGETGDAGDAGDAGDKGGAGDAGDAAGLAADIGGLLSALHRIDPARVPPTPDGWEHEPWGELRTELAAVAGVVRPLLGPELLRKAEPYLAGQVSEPPQDDGPRRFIHNDICPDHLIVDAEGGHLNGLIDFTDAMVGDPVLDFVGLIGLGGYRFINRVAAGYDLPLGDGFGAKLEWLSRVLTLTWLADAVADDPASIGKHLSWVARAFSP